MHLPQFQYRPMDLSKDSIRLVRLCHGSRGPVECELFEGFLDDSHRIEYEALSYTWGGLEKEAEILVNGCSYRVTANLFKALVHLRDRNRDRVLWIDAICIDQDNHKERGHQVAQMKLIYEKSDEVIVWLGESSPDADLAMEFLSRLDKEVASNGAVWRRLSKIDWQSEIKIGFRDFLETIQPNQLHQIKSALEQLFRRPWFTRAWIIQEIASARRAIILCGYWSVRSRAMAIAPSVMKLSIPEHVRAILQVFPGLQRQDSWWNSGQRSLRTLLAKFRRSEATLQRDKVFALLGIATDACEVIHPDYEKSDQEICEQVASFFAFGKITSEPILRTSTWDPGSVHFRFDALIQHILEKPMLYKKFHENGQVLETMPSAQSDPLAGMDLSSISWTHRGLFSPQLRYRGPANTTAGFGGAGRPTGLSRAVRNFLFTGTVQPGLILHQVLIGLAATLGQWVTVRLILGYVAVKKMGYNEQEAASGEGAIWIATYKRNLDLISLIVDSAYHRTTPTQSLGEDDARRILGELATAEKPLTLNPTEGGSDPFTILVYASQVRLVDYLLTALAASAETVMRLSQWQRWGQNATEILGVLSENGELSGPVSLALRAFAVPCFSYSSPVPLAARVRQRKAFLGSVLHNHVQSVRIWVRRGIHIGVEDPSGQERSALSLAAELGHTELVELLSDSSAAKGDKDAEGRSPLHWAVCRWNGQNKAVVETLLKSGVPLDAKDSRGLTALAHAQYQYDHGRSAWGAPGDGPQEDDNLWPQHNRDELQEVIRLLQSRQGFEPTHLAAQALLDLRMS